MSFTSHYPKTRVPVVNNPIRSKTLWWNISFSKTPWWNISFSVFLKWDWQAGCLWWGVARLRFHVDLKSNFGLKNNSIEFLPDQITRWINRLFELQLKLTWHHSKLAVEKVNFICRHRVALLQWYINTPRSSRHDGLGCHVPVGSTSKICQNGQKCSRCYLQYVTWGNC